MQERTEVDAQGSENGVGYYVYAIGERRMGDAPGDGGAPHLNAAQLPADAEPILPGTVIETLVYRDMCAIFSPVPLTEFSQEALEENLKKTDWVRDRVVAHQITLAALLASYTIIPLKFCTVYLSRERVMQTLIDHSADFEATLRLLRGATEWGVKVYCNLPTYARQIEASSDALSAQRDAVARSRPGTAYFLRKKLEQAAEREAERVVTMQVQDIHTQLAAQSRRTELNKAQTAQEHGHSDEMFLNAAYLVENVNWQDFQRTFDGLTNTLGKAGFTIDLTGPWPPYNFATDEITEVHAT